jgi:hypothetical protein
MGRESFSQMELMSVRPLPLLQPAGECKLFMRDRNLPRFGFLNEGRQLTLRGEPVTASGEESATPSPRPSPGGRGGVF